MYFSVQFVCQEGQKAKYRTQPTNKFHMLEVPVDK